MHSPEHCFTPFKQAIADISLPERFTFPFYYDPHPLSLMAAQQLQQHIESQTLWQHNFGLTGIEQGAIGKMFGVLVVRNQAGEIGFLSAFSGKLADSNLLPHFVPPVFDMLTEDSFFLSEQVRINQLTADLNDLMADPKLAEYKANLADKVSESEQAIAAQRQLMIENRKLRKVRRVQAESSLMLQISLSYKRN